MHAQTLYDLKTGREDVSSSDLDQATGFSNAIFRCVRMQRMKPGIRYA